MNFRSNDFPSINKLLSHSPDCICLNISCATSICIIFVSPLPSIKALSVPIWFQVANYAIYHNSALYAALSYGQKRMQYHTKTRVINTDFPYTQNPHIYHIDGPLCPEKRGQTGDIARRIYLQWPISPGIKGSNIRVICLYRLGTVCATS
jgi:hypothetical protein